MRILVAAFEPFGGDAVNPAQLTLEALPCQIGGHTLEKVLLPVAYQRTLPVLLSACHEGLDAILILGMAGGRTGLTVERIAINLDDASLPDNDGLVRTDAPIRPDGPAAIFATVPVKRMVEAIREAGLTASVSLSAGAFLCNHTLYEALVYASPRGMQAGFIHIPFLPDQRENAPSMTLEEDIRGITAAIACM